MNYYYQGKAVELVPNQQYSTHWNFYWNEGGRRTIRSGQPGIDLHPSPVVSPPPTVYGEHGRTVEPLDEEAVSSEAVATIKVNDASFTDIRRALPGIGRIAAKAIATNRPKPGGYKDFDHLLELNKAQLQGVNINWEEVKVKLEF